MTLDEIALPYALAICEHLKAAPKQATSASSQFLDDCRAFNAGDRTQDQFRDAAVRRGFNNVVDAFHRLGPADLNRRFFMDERKGSRGLRLTDDLRALAASRRPHDLAHENEARWRLVETAWELGLSRSLIEFEGEGETLTVQRRDRRVAVSSCRAALNGYQKGHCFYCFRGIGIEGDDDVADVDHFLPWAIRSELGVNLDGVWNLVLACRDCNRGQAGKFDFIPTLDLLERLNRRNEFLIMSHHPLRETLIAQTGGTPAERASFLNARYAGAVAARISRWSPREAAEAAF